MHVATTGTRAWVQPLLDRIFGDRFQTVVTGTEVPDLKPSPAAYLEVLDQTGCDPVGTVAVEDSGNGVRAAIAAGCAAWPPTTPSPATTTCREQRWSPMASRTRRWSPGSATGYLTERTAAACPTA